MTDIYLVFYDGVLMGVCIEIGAAFTLYNEHYPTTQGVLGEIRVSTISEQEWVSLELLFANSRPFH